MDTAPARPDDIGRIFREESGRVIASLVRRFGDIDLAEDAVQDAFVVASERWPADGVPPNPGGWITTTAQRRTIDRLRRERTRAGREADADVLAPDGSDGPMDLDLAPDPVGDDRLRLIFTCCHPALAPESQIALTLRLIAGLHASEIARAFLVPEATMRQRLTRAKAKIRDANIPYRIPGAAALPDRLRPVLTVIYLIANEAHTASTGDDLGRDDLAAEAVRLARLLAELMPDEPEVLGLLALLLLTEARRPARAGADGSLVALSEQDRTRWDSALIEEGQDLVRRCLRRNQPGPFQIQAAINAVHDDAMTAAATDWRQIVQLYDQLLAVQRTPIVALNRALARAELDPSPAGIAGALAEIEALPLEGYQPAWAARADLLRRLGQTGEAAAAYRQAIDLTGNGAERRFLERRLAEVQAGNAVP